MSRSGYVDDMDDQWAHIRWRGAVASAIRGKRGQAFLKEMLATLDAMPEKQLIAHELVMMGDSLDERLIVGADRLVTERGEGISLGGVCAIGAVGLARGIDMSKLDPEEPGPIAAAFGINEKMVREIVYMNDEGWYGLTPEKRFAFMRSWVVSQIIADAP